MIHKKIIVLHRVSSDSQDFESQNNAIEDYIRENNIVVDEYIKEEGISGYSNKLFEREAIKKIYDMALLDELDTLIVFNLDRIGRTTEVAEFLKKLTYCDVKVYSVTEGLLNGGEDTQDLINYIKSFSAQMESKKTSLRVRSGKEATNKKGLFSGGTVNFGYGVENQKMFVIEKEAKIVRLIFDLYMKEGKAGTVRFLKEKGITKRGRPFSHHMVNDILKDTIYIGLKRYGHYILTDKDPTIKARKFSKESMKFQPYNESLRIISDDLFYKVQEKIQGNTIKKGNVTKLTNKTNVLFEGLLYHRCGDREIRKLHLDRKKDKYGNYIYSYRCSHCRRQFYKNVIKTYGCKKYNPVIEEHILNNLRLLSIEELEQKIIDNNKNGVILIQKSLNENEKELTKREKALSNARKELELIFLGESDMEKGVINTLIIKLTKDIEELRDNIKILNDRLEEAKSNFTIDSNLINKYKNFNFAYSKADSNYKKLLMQEVVEKIIIDGEELRITFYID